MLGSKDLELNMFRISDCICWQIENKTYLE